MPTNLSVCSTSKRAPFRAASRQSAGLETAEQVKLYKSAVHPGHWIAYATGAGWVIFPARANGWEERHNARGLDPMHLRQVPLEAALDTGMIEALRSADNGKAA